MTFFKRHTPLLLLLLFLSLAACSEDEVIPAVGRTPTTEEKDDSDTTLNNPLGGTVNSKDYLPLSIGNAWKINFYPWQEVVSTDTIIDKVFYLTTQKWRNRNGEVYFIDSVYFNLGEQGKIYGFEPGNPMSLVFDLEANVGDNWPSIHGYRGMLKSKTESITIGNSTYDNCYEFRFYVPNWFDEEFTIVLAPGIGFIRRKTEWILPQNLDTLILDGQMYIFN